jgi:DNA-binding FrmR family transcriptional regulator
MGVYYKGTCRGDRREDYFRGMNTGGASPMEALTKKACKSRLNRIEGQVRGLVTMIDAGRYCIDVVDQARAVVSALEKVESEILKDHISHCLEGAIRVGDKVAQREKLRELVATLSRRR